MIHLVLIIQDSLKKSHLLKNFSKLSQTQNKRNKKRSKNIVKKLDIFNNRTPVLASSIINKIPKNVMILIFDNLDFFTLTQLATSYKFLSSIILSENFLSRSPTRYKISNFHFGNTDNLLTSFIENIVKSNDNIPQSCNYRLLINEWYIGMTRYYKIADDFLCDNEVSDIDDDFYHNHPAFKYNGGSFDCHCNKCQNKNEQYCHYHNCPMENRYGTIYCEQCDDDDDY